MTTTNSSRLQFVKRSINETHPNDVGIIHQAVRTLTHLVGDLLPQRGCQLKGRFSEQIEPDRETKRSAPLSSSFPEVSAQSESQGSAFLCEWAALQGLVQTTATVSLWNRGVDQDRCHSVT